MPETQLLEASPEIQILLSPPCIDLQVVSRAGNEPDLNDERDERYQSEPKRSTKTGKRDSCVTHKNSEKRAHRIDHITVAAPGAISLTATCFWIWRRPVCARGLAIHPVNRTYRSSCSLSMILMVVGDTRSITTPLKLIFDNMHERLTERYGRKHAYSQSIIGPSYLWTKRFRSFQSN